MKHTARELSRRMDNTPDNEDDWIFQMPRKWFRKAMRFRWNRNRKILGRSYLKSI